MEFVNDKKGTYVAVKYTNETNTKLFNYIKSLNITPMNKNDFHSTIVYSPISLDIPLSKNNKVRQEKVKPIKLFYLGEVDSEYRAIVLEIESVVLQERYDYYTNEKSYINNHKSYIQHISLAYKPNEDMDLEDLPLPNFPIVISHEYVENLKG